MVSHRPRCAALVCVICLIGVLGAAPTRSAAQSGRGVLAGKVLNADGKPVSAAQVFYQGAEGTSPHVLRTNAQGRFRSAPIRAGLYDVRAESRGRWSEWARNVVVRGGGEENLMLRLVRSKAPGH